MRQRLDGSKMAAEDGVLSATLDKVVFVSKVGVGILLHFLSNRSFCFLQDRRRYIR